MKGFLFLCGLALSLAVSTSGNVVPCSVCPTYGPTVPCPPCVNARCTPAMCNEAVAIPYPGDCTKFCICNSDGATEMICPPGLEWDDENKLCNWPGDASCDINASYPGCDAPTTTNPPTTTTSRAPTTTTSRAPTTTTTSLAPTTTTTSLAPTTTTTRAPTTTTVPNDPNPTPPCPTYGPTIRCPACVNNRCTPDTCNSAVSVPHPADCSKFCVCDSAGAIEMSCPPGLEWDNTNQICNWPRDANCDTSAPYPGCNAPIDSIVPSDPVQCTTPAPGPTVRCPACVTASCTPAMCNEAVTRPYPGDCTKFCICDSAGAIAMNCPPGLEWDNVNNLCNWPEVARCDASVVLPGC